MAVVSICPPEAQPAHADNWLIYDSTKWGVWERINDWLRDSEEDSITEDDVWVLSWDIYWDPEQIVDEVASGAYGDDGQETTVEYMAYETLEWVEEYVSQDSHWLGDTAEFDMHEGPANMAMDITGEIIRGPVTLGQEVRNAALLPFIEWRCSLYKGGFRQIA